MSDWMEIGDGLIPEDDGWYFDRHTGNRVDPMGRVYDSSGECIYDPENDDHDADD